MGDELRFGIFPRDLLVRALILEGGGFLWEGIRFSLGRAKGTGAAGEYALRHIRDRLFWEDPLFGGGKAYFAQATYWKGSPLSGREEPHYPVAYTLVQAQTVAALRGLARLNGSLGLGHNPGHWRRGQWNSTGPSERRYGTRSSVFPVIALDGGGPIQGISSDALHLLTFLRPEDIPQERLEGIRIGAEEPVGSYGLRAGLQCPWGQKARAPEVVDCGLRVLRALEKLGFVELFYWAGVPPQLG